MARDMSQRVTLARVDDIRHQNTIAIARNLIYEKNYAVDSKAIERLLKEQSLVPTVVRVHSLNPLLMHNYIVQNAFSDPLSSLGLDRYSMLVVDLMHEVELGTLKALFIHLLRILDCVDPGLINELNRRYDYLISPQPIDSRRII
jgi:hypothetical protein